MFWAGEGGEGTLKKPEVAGRLWSSEQRGCQEEGVMVGLLNR